MKKIAVLSFLVVVSSVGCRKEEAEPAGAESMAMQGLEDDTEASQASLDASELAIEGPAFAFGTQSGSCEATVTGNAALSACGRNIPGTRTVSWSCTGPNGNGISGSATVVTTVIDDTSCPSVAIRHGVTFARVLTAGNYEAELAGTSQVDLVLNALNRTAQRTVTLSVTRQVHRDEELIRDQVLTGERVADLALNQAGPEDDTRTVNGNATIDFLLADAQLDIGSTDLVWQRSCCHPVSGTLDWTFSGNQEAAGSVTFGPACGDAVRDDDSEVSLRPCPLFD